MPPTGGGALQWLIQWVTDKGSQARTERDARTSAARASEVLARAHRIAAVRAAGTWRATYHQISAGAVTSAARIRTAYVGAFAAMGTAMRTFLAPLLGIAALYKFITFSRDAVAMAVNAGETLNKYQVTFGESAAKMDEFIDRWATMAGLSDTAARDMLATTADITQGMGFAQAASADLSIQIGELAGDLTSFKNVPIEQSLDGINGALVGQYERMRSLGIIITATEVQQRAMANTGKDTADALTQQEKATATLQIITDRAANSIGDLEKTQDSLANQTRAATARWANFQEMFGQVLLTFVDAPGIVGGFNDSLAKATEWFERNQMAITGWGRFVTSTVRHVWEVLENTVQFLFNTGQVIGNSLELAFNQMIGNIFRGANAIGRAINWLLEKVDSIPGVNVPFRIGELPANDFLERANQNFADLEKNAREAGAAIVELADSTTQWGQSLMNAVRGGDAEAVLTVGGGGSEDTGTDEDESPLPIPGEDEIEELSEFTGAVEDEYEQVRRLTERTAEDVADSWRTAFQLMRDEGATVGNFFVGMARGVGSAMVGALGNMAQAKVAENTAAAAEDVAWGMSYAANPWMAHLAAGRFAAAAKHLLAATAWGALAAGGSMGASAISGGGGGGGGAGGAIRGQDGTRTPREFPDQTVNVFIDPNDPYNPVFQERVYVAGALATERLGTGARVRVMPTRMARR